MEFKIKINRVDNTSIKTIKQIIKTYMFMTNFQKNP